MYLFCYDVMVMKVAILVFDLLDSYVSRNLVRARKAVSALGSIGMRGGLWVIRVVTLWGWVVTSASAVIVLLLLVNILMGLLFSVLMMVWTFFVWMVGVLLIWLSLWVLRLRLWGS